MSYEVVGYCGNCYSDIVIGDHMNCCGERKVVTLPAVEHKFVVRHIPFYDGDRVRKLIGNGRLRGRGPRRFKNPIMPTRDGGTYRKSNAAMDHCLPQSMAIEFTLYTNTTSWRYDYIRCDFKGWRDGKAVLRLQY